MSFTGLPQGFPAYVAALEQRIRALESRTVSTAGGTVAHTHLGSGLDSTVVAGLGGLDAALASGTDATAGGARANAEGSTSVALGWEAHTLAAAAQGVAIGQGATAEASADIAIGGGGCDASGGASLAIGVSAAALHEQATAVGASARTTNTNQVQLGTGSASGLAGVAARVVMGAPNSAIADADLANGQISFYLDEGGNTLTVKVKYSTGTVKTGTVALV